VLTLMLTRRFIVPLAATLVLALGAVMLMRDGRDFFPAIDGGQIKLHVRAPAATRIDATRSKTRRQNHCAVAFSRTGDPATGDFHDATVLRKFGDVPGDLSAL